MKDDTQLRIRSLENRIEELEAELEGVIEDRDYWRDEVSEQDKLMDARNRFDEEMASIEAAVRTHERRGGSSMQLIGSALTGAAYGISALALVYLFFWLVGTL